ncbi:MarR family winged helix-turn-helix transcriptional regulator [Solimonas soli]|uniref:MarR family winged helix-turn-helix transcriptional regulator n=1 Tax=Solimonas soli TaxID=413479 RepID=UPI001FE210A6|nr:MarR family transcriptional regulator [Solimonas soli]
MFYDPLSFNSRSSLGYLLKMTHAQMHACAERIFAEHDINFVQWIALLKLHEGDALTASDLCRAMCHDNGAVTRMLDHLEQRGYVERQRSQQDRRVVELKLTANGKRKMDELLPQVVAGLNEVLNAAGFSRDEFNELARLLNKLLLSMQALNGAAGENT